MMDIRRRRVRRIWSVTFQGTRISPSSRTWAEPVCRSVAEGPQKTENRNRKMSSLLFYLLSSPRYHFVSKYRKGYRLPPRLLLFVLFSLLSVSSAFFFGGGINKEDGRQGFTEDNKEVEQSSDWFSACVDVWADSKSSNVSQAPLLMLQPPSSLPFLPPFSSFTLPLLISSPLLSMMLLLFSTFVSFLLRCLLVTWLMKWLHSFGSTACLPLVSASPCLSRPARSVRPCAALHNNRAQIELEPSTLCEGRGVSARHTGRNTDAFLLKGTYTLHSSSTRLISSLPFSLTFSPNCLITTSCNSGQQCTDLPHTPTPSTLVLLLSIWYPLLYSFSLSLISTLFYFHCLFCNCAHACVVIVFFLTISQGRWVCFCMTEQLTQR